MKKQKITIIGAGNNGLTMAAHLAYHGYDICLWNRSYETIEKIIKTKTTNISGEINAKTKITSATTSMQEALENSKIIFVTLPAHTHNELAVRMSPYIEPNSIVILNPGRTFGALEFYNVLKNENCENMPIIGETQTIIYTCRKTAPDAVSLLAFKTGTLFSCLNYNDFQKVINDLPPEIGKYYIKAKSFLETSLGNVGMILHCAPVLLNTGWIENKKARFLYYYDGITPSIAALLEKLDKERISVAEAMGVKIPSVQEWIYQSYNVKGINLFESIQLVESYHSIDAPQTLMHRYLFEDISTGLVPIEALGQRLGLKMKITSLIIDLASEMLNFDFRENGRNMRKLNIYDLNFGCLKIK